LSVLLISTYELGRQPFGIASPAAWLRKRGHRVTVLDLSRQSLDEAAVRSAGLISVYLPMHTATRLAAELIPRLRELNPSAHFCCHGLYAPMNVEFLRSLGVASILGGEFEEGLSKLADQLASNGCALGEQDGGSFISTARQQFDVPDRAGLPPMEKYAHLNIPGDGYRIVGSTEASRGCKHLCRHCPIVPVYQGVFRIVGHDVVMEDIRRQVAAGAQHITFGDPDFFNGIGYAMQLVESFHREFPGVTYDVTIKIEHLLKYEKHLATLRDTGCLFVISAVEAVDDTILNYLDKGHTRGDFLRVIQLFRELSMTLHPTFVPFTPWTTLDGYLDLLRVIESQGVIENVAPIQLGIRLLIPEGSRLLELEEVRNKIGPFDPQLLAYPWKTADSRLDALSENIRALAGAAEQRKESRFETFQRIWNVSHEMAGKAAPRLDPQLQPNRGVPFMSEPWYCCAEPTPQQLVSIGVPKPATKAVGATLQAAANGFV